MGGSEDCKHNSYNAIQIINLRNISDIKQNMQYPYSNYRLNPILWRERINYSSYFNKSIAKYLTTESKVVSTTMPITIVQGKEEKEEEEKEEEKKQQIKPLIISQSETTHSTHSPWSAVNSPYSPFTKLAVSNNNNNNNMNLNPFAQIDEFKMQNRQRAKSQSNITKLAKKDIKKIKQENKNKNKTKIKNKNKHKIKAKSMKKLKSTTKKCKNKLSAKSPKSRRASSMLTTKKRKKSNKSRKNMMNAVTDNISFDRYSYGECIMSISSDMIGGVLPSWPWLKAKYASDIKRAMDKLEFAKYKMFIRCGGIYTKDDEYSNENDLIFFNAANLNDIGRDIDCYYCKLPSLKQKIESPAIVYNNLNNLLSFGGYSYSDGKALKSIYSLNLNTKRSKFKWKKYGCLMMKARYDSSVTHIVNNIGRNKFIIIGGKGSSTKPIYSCEMFDSSKTSKQSKCMLLNELNFARFKPGSCQLNGDESKISVCGGILYGKGANMVEIYDLNKDKWMIHATPLQYDHQHPSIWSEVKEINPNILYVAGNNISFGAKKGSLGYIEWTDLRIKDKKFNLLYDEPIEQLFEFWGLRPNIWEPRSLLQFAL